jgi:hypothetical protein
MGPILSGARSPLFDKLLGSFWTKCGWTSSVRSDDESRMLAYIRQGTCQPGEAREYAAHRNSNDQGGI